jgi:hypothetical protein
MKCLYNLIYKYRDEITDFILYLNNLKHRGTELVIFFAKGIRFKIDECGAFFHDISLQF